MSEKYAVEVKNLYKSFKLPTEKSNNMKQTFVNWTKGVKGYEEQRVLKGISFNVEKGDFFGIVGRNGSGKSTLLKLIAGIYEPDKGSISVNGTIVPFIELGVGFNPELTGRENIYLNGALLGFSTKQIDAMYDDIVNFAELHDFMNQKLKNYSSGMQVRLAFSIAIKAQGDILILDEVLAVGDEAFQRKCYNYFAELKRDKKTVILVTHSMDSVQQFCTRAMLIEDGKIPEIGNTAKVARLYRKQSSNEQDVVVNKKTDNKNFQVVPSIEKTREKVHFKMNIIAKKKIKDPIITFVVYRSNGELVYRWTSDEKIKNVIDLDEPKQLNITLENIFPDGEFNIQVGIKSRDRSIEYALFDNIIRFEIVSDGTSPNDSFWKPKEEYSLR